MSAVMFQASCLHRAMETGTRRSSSSIRTGITSVLSGYRTRKQSGAVAVAGHGRGQGCHLAPQLADSPSTARGPETGCWSADPCARGRRDAAAAPARRRDHPAPADRRHDRGGESGARAAIERRGAPLTPRSPSWGRDDRDDERYPDLDTFLAALGRGEVTGPGPQEPSAKELLGRVRASVPRTPESRRITGPDALERHCSEVHGRIEATRRAEHACCDCLAPMINLRDKRCLSCRRNRRSLEEVERNAALAAGARFLASVLRDRGIDPFGFPDGTPQPYMTHETVAAWLEGTDPAYGCALGMAGTHWGLGKELVRLVGWSYRPPRMWPVGVREVLESEFTRLGIDLPS